MNKDTAISFIQIIQKFDEGRLNTVIKITEVPRRNLLNISPSSFILKFSLRTFYIVKIMDAEEVIVVQEVIE